MIFIDKMLNGRYLYQINEPFNLNAFVNSVYDNVEYLSLLNSNENSNNQSSCFTYHNYKYLLAVCTEQTTDNTIQDLGALDAFYSKHKDWLFGHFSYDLKNKLHHLSSNNQSEVDFKTCFFFVPNWVIYENDKGVFIESLEPLKDDFFKVNTNEITELFYTKKIDLQAQISQKEYIDTVKILQDHIQKGDIYEANFCQNFYAHQVDISPFAVFIKLTEKSPTPFASFYKLNNCYLLSASPERYLVKQGKKLVSQPIKGTSKRNTEGDINQQIKSLKQNQKEQSENVMIVDLVRNDLSRIAQKGSVQVNELFGIYPFNQVWQMISTVSCQIHEDVKFSDILESSFPMGSMTGAPKIRAMELIEKNERFKRGLFSGSVGYISPSGDFDFNVVIRSILYDQSKKLISVPVGSAITILSDPDSEYEECLLKIDAIRSILSSF